METILQGQQSHSALYREEIKKRSDKLMNYFLISFFAIGLILAPFYGTWLLAVGSGSGCLAAYYFTRFAFRKSNFRTPYLSHKTVCTS